MAHQVFAHGAEGAAILLEAVIESGGEEAGFDAEAAQDLLLAEGEVLDGKAGHSSPARFPDSAIGMEAERGFKNGVSYF
jgi:hypothetical protein